MPSHFKALFTFMSQLDQVLLFFKGRHKPAYFEDLKPSIETITHMNFLRSHFAQILTVDPTLYQFEWQTVAHKGRDLLIFPSETLTDSSIKARKEKFYTSLMDISIRYYNEWATKHGIVFDAVKHKMWHYKFDPHNKETVLNIQQADISDKQGRRRDKSVVEFMQESSVKREKSTNVL